MDAYEATKIVMSRIHSLDPENTSRIIGYILLQDEGDKEMVRLALGSDALLLSCLNQAKACLGLFPNTISPKSLNNQSNSPPSTVFQFGHCSNPSRPISYAAVVNGSNSSTNADGSNRDSCSPSLHFYGGNELGDEFLSDGGVRRNGPDHSDPTVSPSDSLIFPFGEDGWGGIPSPHPHPHPHPHSHPFHRRSCSVNDAVFLPHGEEGKPCMYFAKGFCKNGSSCKFTHSDIGDCDEGVELGSSFDDFFSNKGLQQQRFALMEAGGRRHYAYNKSSNFLNDNQRCGPRNQSSSMGMGAAMASSSRQIYLTFPVDSTFKEEDVSGYFSMFGPVQDVRIPYQQKRMFGFVTFVYPETVRLILAKGNPHFVCDSRVLVKPYKEKGKILDKKQLQQQHQHLERGEYSSCLSPSAIGSRMFLNTQEMMRRRMEHEMELQNAIELQGRRMGNLQLMDLKYQQLHNRFPPRFLGGVPVSSPRQCQSLTENVVVSSDGANPDVLQEFDDWQETSKTAEADEDGNKSSSYDNRHVNDDDYLVQSLEHILPDTLFASPTKSAAEHHQSAFFPVSSDDNSLINSSSNYASVLPSSSRLGMASVCYSQMLSENVGVSSDTHL